jgi:Protein of unknown function (DUF2510)
MQKHGELAAAGWYPDPAGAPRQRYFDGQEWTERYSDQYTCTAALRHERADRLNADIADNANGGWRVESHTQLQAVHVRPGEPQGNVLHVVVTVMTCGALVAFLDSVSAQPPH